MFTKQHYEGICKILKKNNANNSLVNDFVSYFASDNPRFDASRFIKCVSK